MTSESSLLTWILTINAGSLITVITVGVKVLRVWNRMEFQLNLLWSDYQKRHRIITEGEA